MYGDETYDWVVKAGAEKIRDGLVFIALMIFRILLLPLFIVGAVAWIIDAKKRGHSWHWNFTD